MSGPVHPVTAVDVRAALALAIWILLSASLAAYLLAAGRERRGRRGWSGWRIAAFVLGTALLGTAASPGLAEWAHHDPRGHMVRHLILGMLAPLGLVLAAPVTLLLRSLPPPAARRVVSLLRSRPARVVGHPVAALLLDTGALYLLYLTPLYAAALAHPLLHAVVHLHFLAAGALFVWSIAGPDPAPHRPGFRVRLAVLFTATAAHGTLAKVMYAYGWPRGTPHDPDRMREAAMLMYYGGDLAELLLAVALFGAWYRAGGRRASREAAAPARPPEHRVAVR